MSTTPADSTLLAAKDFRRRTLLKGALAAGTATAAGSFLIPRRSLASSGEVNVYVWGEYISEEMERAFQEETGIKINKSVYGTNNEVLTKLTASGGDGSDLVFPSVTTLVSWYDAGDLLQPVDESRINVEQIQPAIWEKSLDLGATRRGERYGVPFNWGTEGIAFNSEMRDLKYGDVSWATQWEEQNKGLVSTRPRSVLVTSAILLDGTGELLDAAHRDEETAREVFDRALEFAIAHKPWVLTLWKDAQALTNSFLQDGAAIGQSWDGTAINMWKESDGLIKYVAPREGALTWLDTMALPSGAENVDEAYALMNWLISQEGGGMHVLHSGYNSAAIGAETVLDDAAADRYAFMYGPNGEAIADLYWWKPEPAWFQQLRAEYITRYETA